MSSTRLQHPETAASGSSRGLLKTQFKPMPIFLSIILFLSAGTAYAAEATLPGDLLYPVKTEINEEVRAAFTFGQEAKAEWSAERVERRLEEAEKLALVGKLDAELTARLQANFQKQEEKAEGIIKKLEDKGNTQAAARLNARLETVIEVHEQILAGLSQDTYAETFLPLLNQLKNKADTHAETRTRIEGNLQAESGLETASENARQHAETQIEVAVEAVALAEAKFGAEAVLGLKSELQRAIALKTQADDHRLKAEYKQALEAYIQSQNIAHSVEIAARSQIRLELEIDLQPGPLVEVKSKLNSSTRVLERSDDSATSSGESSQELESEFENESQTHIEGVLNKSPLKPRIEIGD